MPIRDATLSDFEKIVLLNDESVHFLSPLGAGKLADMHGQAAYHRVMEIDGSVEAFLLVFGEGAYHDSVNYQWFCQRYNRFLYVDRIVTSLASRGRSLGKALYEDLFLFARENDFPRIACEFDIDPANEVSGRFHERFGFREVGKQRLDYANKQVSMQMVVL